MKRKYYRYALYVLELFLLSVLEGTPGLLPVVYYAKPMLLVEELDNSAFLQELVTAMEPELPAPKQKKK